MALSPRPSPMLRTTLAAATSKACRLRLPLLATLPRLRANCVHVCRCLAGK